MRSRLDTEIDPMLHVQRLFYGGFLFSNGLSSVKGKLTIY